jgi:hypothetical protein
VRARIAICAAALAVVCAIPPVAGGKTTTNTYKGGFDPSGTLKFNRAKKKHTPAAVGAFSFTKFPLICDGAHNTETSSLNFSVLVKDQKFHAKGIIHGQGHPAPVQSSLLLEGKFSRDHRKAHGTMRVFGKQVPVDNPGGTTARCHSGKVPWTAHLK